MNAPYIIIVSAWSGNRRPWRAKVYCGGTLSGDGRSVDGGRYVGHTGGCASQGGARDAARAIVAADDGVAVTS